MRDRLSQLATLGGVIRSARANYVTDNDVVLHARLTFGEFNEGLLTVHEDIRLPDDGVPHRYRYSYQCQYGTDFLFREDRDPIQHPGMVEHRHVPPDDRRIKSRRVTLHDVVDEFWPMVCERDEQERAERGDASGRSDA